MSGRSVLSLVLLFFFIFSLSHTDAMAASANARRRHGNSRIRRVSLHSRLRYARRRLLPDAGILAQTLDGDVLMEQEAEKHFNPASVMKIATSFAALNKLGYDYRFRTPLYTNGSVDKEGKLNGDLIIGGVGDPGFFTENAFLIIDNLHKLGIQSVAGNLIIIAPFYFNFDVSTAQSGEAFFKLCQGRWSEAEQRTWRDYVGAQGNADREFKNIEFSGQLRVDSESSREQWQKDAHLLFTHLSRPLPDLLKSQNDFSNNFMAEAMGRAIGGPATIEKFLVNDLGIAADQVRVSSASGLGDNLITPQAALKLLRLFYKSVTAQGRKIEDLLPVAGMDAGTLDKRFTNPELRGSVVAKTGTLGNQNVSALVGIAYTRERGVLLFAILNRDAVPRAREHQDEIVTDLIYQCGGPLCKVEENRQLSSSPQVLLP
jgi:D-alanyl-D-alanine carboxypeptidase/D-alanyl-D-alanine-endopeptidase (penicillin-binding protein 4)